MLKKLKQILFSPRKVFLGVVILFGILFVTNGVPFVYSDGVYYYHVAESVIEHGTFASSERPEYWDYRGHAIAYYNGKYVEVVSPGTSLVLMPGLEIAHLLRTTQTTYNDYFMAFNGHTLADGLAVLITAVLFGLATIVLIYKLLCEIGFSNKVALVSTFATYASSYAVWYVFLSAAFTHTYEMFFMALILWALAKFRNVSKSKYIYILGIGLGMLVLIRPIFAVIALIIGLYFLFKRQFKQLFQLVLTGIPFALFEMWYNYVSYGNPFSTGYTEIRGEMLNLSTWNQLNVLFSPYRGWFVYSPVFLLCVIGLIWMWRKSRAWAAINLLSIAAIVGIYGFWPAWWGGGSYGSRFLILLVPNAAIGLAFLLTKLAKWQMWRRFLLGLITLCVVWSLLLTVLYRFTPVAQLRPFSDSYGNMSAGDRYTPIDMINYHLDLVKNAASFSGYLNSVYHSGTGGNSLAILVLGASDIAFRLDDRTTNHPQMFMVAPPIMHQPVPTQIDFYFVDRRDNKIYEGQILNLELNEKISLNCTVVCVSTSPKLTIQLSQNPPHELAGSTYSGVRLENSPIDLYFSRTFNVQFKGPEIRLADGQQNFQIP